MLVFKELNEVSEINTQKNVFLIILSVIKKNYHLGKIIGMGVYDGDNLFLC
ncbi:MAG: hypothetical protein L6V78_06465 [Clostridium sp.]|nr:MAG: hypothetical protein L6V78_06465 [Clostridium sp.]